jgi:hypothetical protein
MRGLWSTIALVVVLAGLGAYIYFVDSKRPAGGIEEKQKVFSVEADKIEEITLTSENETSTLRKTDGTWKLTAPVAADANQTEVSSLTSNLASLEVNRVVDENASNLAEFGLANPRIAISFKGQGGVSGQLHLGDKTATQSDVYAVKPGEKRVFLVSSFQETTFAKKPFDLRDKRVLNFERDKVDSIEIVQAGETPIQLARSGSEWVIKQPVQVSGDYGAVEGLLTKLSSANMTKIVEGDPSAKTAEGAASAKTAEGGASAPPASSGLAKYGLEKPAVTVTLGAGSARATLALGKEEEGAVFARDQSRGTIFTVEPSLATDLKKPVGDYRDKDLFEFRSFNAARVRLTRGTDTFEFQKVAGSGENAAEKWQRVASSGGAATDVDSTKMDDLLSKLTGLRAQSFKPTHEGTGLDKPGLVVSASYDGGKFERVRLAKPAKEAYGSRDGAPGAAVLDASAYDEVLKALDAVVTPAPAPPAAPAK